MATVRQILANRRNAQHSTGPITDEGKNASRRNALKHGLTGSEVLRDEDQDAVQCRMVEWRPQYHLETPEHEWFFEQLVVNSVKLDRCREQEAALIASESHRAALSWDDDRRQEVEELADKLSKRPALICGRLKRTRQGVEWMIERWRALGQILDRKGEWTESQTALALDLLGTPRELRDDQPVLDDPATLVAREIALLERRKSASLDALDEHERSAAEAGLALTLSKALSNLRRYEAACLRQYHQAAKQLQANRQPPVPAEPTPPNDPLPSTQNQTRWNSGQDIPIPTSSSPRAYSEIHVPPFRSIKS